MDYLIQNDIIQLEKNGNMSICSGHYYYRHIIKIHDVKVFKLLYAFLIKMNFLHIWTMYISP